MLQCLVLWDWTTTFAKKKKKKNLYYLLNILKYVWGEKL